MGQRRNDKRREQQGGIQKEWACGGRKYEIISNLGRFL